MPGSSGSCGQSCLKGSSNRQSYVLTGRDHDVRGAEFSFIVFIIFQEKDIFCRKKCWYFHPKKGFGFTLTGSNQFAASLRCHSNNCFTSAFSQNLLQLTMMHSLNQPMNFLPCVPAWKKTAKIKSLYCEYWLHVVTDVSFHVIQLFHGLLTFPCQKLIPLRLREKVNACKLNTGVWWIAAWVITCAIRGIVMLLYLMKASAYELSKHYLHYVYVDPWM